MHVGCGLNNLTKQIFQRKKIDFEAFPQGWEVWLYREIIKANYFKFWNSGLMPLMIINDSDNDIYIALIVMSEWLCKWTKGSTVKGLRYSQRRLQYGREVIFMSWMGQWVMSHFMIQSAVFRLRLGSGLGLGFAFRVRAKRYDYRCIFFMLNILTHWLIDLWLITHLNFILIMKH